MRCIGCNKLMTDHELIIDLDFCKFCFKSYRENLDSIITPELLNKLIEDEDHE